MGTCSYYRRFIKDFAAIARPMHKLTEKNCPFNWTVECETAFQKLKITLITEWDSKESAKTMISSI
jgi:aminoglycoside phosphotransferase